MNIGAFGKDCEDRVVAFLQSRGYIIKARNYQTRNGEIDIIAEKDEYIAFVEVKAREDEKIVPTNEVIDAVKQQRFKLAANDYSEKFAKNKQVRYDAALVAVKQRDGKATYTLNYIKNAF